MLGFGEGLEMEATIVVPGLGLGFGFVVVVGLAWVGPLAGETRRVFLLERLRGMTG